MAEGNPQKAFKNKKVWIFLLAMGWFVHPIPTYRRWPKPPQDKRDHDIISLNK
jgi:hypothetical protein